MKRAYAIWWWTLVVLLASSMLAPAVSNAEDRSDRAVETKVELWEFTAPWCEHCTRMAPVIRKLADRGIPVRQIPFDDYRSLANQANVDRLPCFLVVVNGAVAGRKAGLSSEQELLALYQSHRPHRDALVNGPAKPIIRGQQSTPGPFGRLGSALSSFPSLTDRFTREPSRPSSATSDSTNTPPNDSSAALAPPPLLNPPRPFSSVQPAGSPVVPPPTTNTAEQGGSNDPISRALNATVLLRIVDPQGISLGTGTIVDVHDNEALVLTCGHIFRDSAGKGAITCDLQGTHTERGISGQLIGYDLKRDVGLVSVRTGREVQPIRIAGPGYQARVQDAVFAIGCSQGEPATIIKNQILAVNRYNGPANLVVGGRPINGRSGGGLFSREGLLIGVCNAADTEADEGLYAALGPIQAELDSAGLDFIYRPRTAAPNAFTSAPSPALPSTARFPVKIASAGASGAATSDTEVICIVRPKGTGADAGQAYVLEKPSQELLSQLSKELGKRGSHQFTGAQQRNSPSHYR